MKFKKKFKKKIVKRIAVFPTLITLGNGVAGFSAILLATQGRFVTASWLILLAMLLDAFDGFIARLTKSSSLFGVQLDSLCDVISFGVAPAFLSYRFTSSYLKHPLSLKAIGVICALYVCCAILRLAKFNVEHSSSISAHSTFSGLPSPGAGGMVVSTILFHAYLTSPESSIITNEFVHTSFMKTANIIPLFLLFLTLFTAILMVTKVRYIHFLNKTLKSHRTFTGFLEILLIFILITLLPELMFFLGFLIYILSGPVFELSFRLRSKNVYVLQDFQEEE